MADLTPVIETLENRWMRAWVNRDSKAMKAITGSDFILLTASKPPVILDRRSWLEAMAEHYHCSSFKFGDIYVRGWGPFALFASPLEIEATMDGHDWSETIWVTDIWRRGRVRRGWKLVQRTVSRRNENPKLRAAIKALQLWK